VANVKSCLNRFLLGVLISVLVVNFGVVYAHTSADKIPAKLSTPEFSVTYKDLSYVIPESTSKDPYTGNIITKPPYCVENRTLQVSINKKDLMKNYSDKDWLIYEVRIKGSFEDEWNIWTAESRANLDFPLTIIVLSSAESYFDGTTGSLKYYFNIPSEGKMDVQIKAQIRGLYWNSNAVPPMSTYSEDALLAESNWSKTQTVIISNSDDEAPNQPQHSPDHDLNSNQTNSQFEGIIVGLSVTEFSLLIAVVSLSIALISVILLFTHRQKKFGLSEKQT
jgi:hypothetical protein